MDKTSEPTMNEQSPAQEENASPEAETPTPAAKPRTPHRRKSASLAHLTITQLTLAVVLAVFLWQWFEAHRQIDSLQQEVARRLSEMDGNNKASMALVKQEQETMRELSVKVGTMETQLAETQNQRAALATLYENVSGSQDETTLADVEQMLLIAGQQLQLSANVKAALIAMQQADDRLKRMGRTALNGVRKVIGHDMEKLRALPDVDVQGISDQLDDLIAAADKLPLTQEIRLQQDNAAGAVAPAHETPWQKLWREIRQDARHLVLIENTEKHELPLLSPTQTFFLRENLKLRLLSARLALVSHDNTSYQQELKTAQQWIQRYFDTKSEAGAQALDALHKLRASSISIELPDISDSLDAVRNYRVSLAKGAR